MLPPTNELGRLVIVQDVVLHLETEFTTWLRLDAWRKPICGVGARADGLYARVLVQIELVLRVLQDLSKMAMPS